MWINYTSVHVHDYNITISMHTCHVQANILASPIQSMQEASLPRISKSSQLHVHEHLSLHVVIQSNYSSARLQCLCLWLQLPTKNFNTPLVSDAPIKKVPSIPGKHLSKCELLQMLSKAHIVQTLVEAHVQMWAAAWSSKKSRPNFGWSSYQMWVAAIRSASSRPSAGCGRDTKIQIAVSRVMKV